MDDTKVIRLTVRLPESLKKQLARKAENEHRSLNAQVVKQLADSTQEDQDTPEAA